VAAKLPELAVILSLIMLGQRFSGYENAPLGYLLVAIGIIALLIWLHSIYGHYSKKEGGPKHIGKFRLAATWITAVILLGFVVYPWTANLRSTRAGRFSASVEHMWNTYPETDFWLFDAPTICDAPVAIFFQVTNLQPVPSMLARFDVEVKTMQDQWMKLEYMTNYEKVYFGGNLNHVYPITATFLDRLIKDHNLPPHEVLRGWMFFWAPPGVVSQLLPEVRITIADVFGVYWASGPLRAVRTSVQEVGCTIAGPFEDLTGLTRCAR